MSNINCDVWKFKERWTLLPPFVFTNTTLHPHGSLLPVQRPPVREEAQGQGPRAWWGRDQEVEECQSSVTCCVACHGPWLFYKLLQVGRKVCHQRRLKSASGIWEGSVERISSSLWGKMGWGAWVGNCIPQYKEIWCMTSRVILIMPSKTASIVALSDGCNIPDLRMK